MSLICLARPTRFELLTPRFVVCTKLLIFLRSVGNPINFSKRLRVVSYRIELSVESMRSVRSDVEGRRGHKDHAALKAALDAWFDEVKKARWSSTADVKRSYATASIVSADRVVFNIKANDYRLVVAIDFEKSIVWIKWVGTHRDYDRIDVKEVRHGG